MRLVEERERSGGPQCGLFGSVVEIPTPETAAKAVFRATESRGAQMVPVALGVPNQPNQETWIDRQRAAPFFAHRVWQGLRAPAVSAREADGGLALPESPTSRRWSRFRPEQRL